MWYTGRTVCGFDAEDAPRDRRGQTVGAGRLLLATLATCVAFGAMWATANLVVTLDAAVQAGPSGRLALALTPTLTLTLTLTLTSTPTPNRKPSPISTPILALNPSRARTLSLTLTPSQP